MNLKLTNEQTQAALAQLSLQPRPTYAEIAASIGSNLYAVRRLDKANQPKKQENPDKALEEFGRRIAKRLPIRQRVDVVAEVARENKANPFVRLRAVELANEFQGMITRKQARETEQSQIIPQPIFVLPPGAQLVSVQPVISQPSQNPDDHK